MSFEKELKIITRGVEEIIPVAEMKDKLALSAKEGRPLRIKYGIDPTGHEVHIGHLVPIRKMRDFQDLGHTGVIIIGDFTAQIGDPTGRDEGRPPLTAEQVRINCERYMEQLFTVLKPEQTEVRYQSEWFGQMGMSEVLKLMGKFTLAQFMAHDTFRNRYEQGLSLGMHEIMYPILQGYDSVAIHSDVELGATEQKFNILCGRDMQRYFGQPQQIAVLSPILMGTDGVNKMSKSLNNYIAVFDSPQEKFGKVMSIPDNLIMNYFCYATTTDQDGLDAIKKELESGINPMIVKKRLAREVVQLYHGAEAAQEAQEGFEKQFSHKEIPLDRPRFKFSQVSPQDNSTRIVNALFNTGSVQSVSAAKRLVEQGGISVNGIKISDPEFRIDNTNTVVIKCGKRTFFDIVPDDED